MTDFSTDTYLARISIAEAAMIVSSPHVVMRARVFADGNQWCCLYGDDLQVGVAGFGDTPQQACAEFDRAWFNAAPPATSR